MSTLLQDLRYGIRMLIKHPGFTIIALLTLALGMAVTSSIFTVVDAVLIRKLPISDPDRVDEELRAINAERDLARKLSLVKPESVRAQ